METEYIKYQNPKRHITVRVNERKLFQTLFHEHHYMTAQMDPAKSLPRQAVFFTFYITENNQEKLFGCLGVLTQKTKTGTHRRVTRMVILPEYQGRGLVKGMLNTISEYYHQNGMSMYISTFHPRLGWMLDETKEWSANSNNQQSSKGYLPRDHKKVFMSGIRDGESMFRYKYISSDSPWSFTLLYDSIAYMKKRRERHNKNPHVGPIHQVKKQPKCMTILPSVDDVFAVSVKKKKRKRVKSVKLPSARKDLDV